jgi:DNA-directed RNA polymerase II subunit RPB1
VNLSNDAVPSLKSQIPEILGKIQLAGIKGVKKAILKELDTFKEDATGKMAKVKPWAIDTEGTALKQVFIGLIDNNTGHNIIDFAKTSSNKIPEVLQLLGIEAARYKMYLELREAYLAYGVVINYRHYMILVDTMCQRGYLMAVSRVGINRSDASGPLMRCSFEETVKVLMGAAAFGERDPVRGVSANIMLGNQARIGTGLFDLMIDLQALRSAVPQEDAIAPGREVNVYHGMASIELSSPSAPYPAGGGMYTPRATDASVFGRHGGAMPSASMPYAAGDFGSSQVYGNAMDFSTIASGAGMYDTAARSDPFTATSLRAGGSDVFIARNIDSAMPSVASDATFNFASSAPYSGGYGGNRSGMASVNLSPSYATASAYSPAASSVQNLSVGARYVPDMPSNNFQSGSHYSADSAKYASSVGSEQYLAESAPVAQREQDAYAPLGDEDEA